jgi:hypothetical protein
MNQFSLDLFAPTIAELPIAVEYTTKEISIVPQVAMVSIELLTERNISDEEIGFEWMVKESFKVLACSEYLRGIGNGQ